MLTREKLLQIIEAIQYLHDETGNHWNKCGLEPAPNSSAEKELLGFGRKESVLTAYSLGHLFIEVAADHLYGFTKLITEPAQSIAPWTCIRAVMEGSAFSIWLLDPEIDSKIRIGRCLAIRHENFKQQQKLARVIGNEADVVKIGERIEEVEKMASQLGYDPVIGKNNKRIGLGQLMPEITSVVRETLDEEFSYRLLSAIAHGDYSVLQLFSYRVHSKGESINLLEKYFDPSGILLLCSLGTRVFMRACWTKNELFGWENKSLINIFELASNRIGIKEGKRFWNL